ncbi:MAG: T9SS type A sorting domain-containing protein [Flavobacteriia bacterium]
MKKLYFLTSFLTVFQLFSFSQLSCGDVFTDSGAETAEYSNNESITTTICPSGGQVIQISFSEFLTEDGYDSLTIFNGNSTADAVIGSYQGTNSPGIVYSTNANGCLTFLFESDGSVTEAGWIASISCVAPITCPKPTNLSFSNATDNAATLSWTAGGSETAWLIEYDTAGFVLGTGNTVVANSNPFSLSGLTASTNYDVYVYAICSSSDSSFASSRFSFAKDISPFNCGNLFVDNGGINDYSSNSADTTTICPNGVFETVSVVFTLFDTEDGYDSLMIFNGSSVNDPLIATYQGLVDTIGTVTSTNPNGCLTFFFESDGSVQNPGWVANIVCIDQNASLTENQTEFITIYPNPSNGIFTISNSSSQKFDIRVSDLKGSMVWNSTIGNADQELNLNHLENGSYFVSFSNSSQTFVKKINIVK